MIAESPASSPWRLLYQFQLGRARLFVARAESQRIDKPAQIGSQNIAIGRNRDLKLNEMALLEIDGRHGPPAIVGKIDRDLAPVIGFDAGILIRQDLIVALERGRRFLDEGCLVTGAC